MPLIHTTNNLRASLVIVVMVCAIFNRNSVNALWFFIDTYGA